MLAVVTRNVPRLSNREFSRFPAPAAFETPAPLPTSQVPKLPAHGQAPVSSNFSPLVWTRLPKLKKVPSFRVMLAPGAFCELASVELVVALSETLAALMVPPPQKKAAPTPAPVPTWTLALWISPPRKLKAAWFAASSILRAPLADDHAAGHAQGGGGGERGGPDVQRAGVTGTQLQARQGDVLGDHAVGQADRGGHPRAEDGDVARP